MKNAYSQKLKRDRAAREMQVAKDWMQLNNMLHWIAMNNLYGYGCVKLERLDEEVDRLYGEFVRDPESATASMLKRIEQIKKNKRARK